MRSDNWTHDSRASQAADGAEQALREAIRRAPGSAPAYIDLVSLLGRMDRAGEAIGLIDAVLAAQPGTPWALSLKAQILLDERRPDEALEVHRALLARAPDASIPWMNYAYALKTAGRVKDAVAAYRNAIRLDPANGFAWWGLANLRTVKLGADDAESLTKILPSAPDGLNRVQLHFALGKVLGDLGRFEASFRNYETANRLRGGLVPYDPRRTRDFVIEAERVFTPEFLRRRSVPRAGDPTMIFIVGMPRSGSTLIEQALASHGMVEAGGELFTLQNLLGQAGGDSAPEAGMLARIGAMDSRTLSALGESYLEAVRRRRKTTRPCFTDKMPANWRFAGLIHAILPDAKIVDVRRQPAACCLSNFMTYFNSATAAPVSLHDLAGYYRDYVRLTDHFDHVLPGRIHRVSYEDAVMDFEGAMRRLFAYLDLPFDPACLRFHETARPIHTPSALQVRAPLNRDGLEHWRNYRPWLTPLIEEFGAVEEDYPFRDAGADPAAG